MKNSSLSEKEQQVLQFANEEQKRKRKIVVEEQSAMLEFSERHGKVAHEYHRALFNKALQAAGIDEAELEKKHEAERNSAIRFLESRKKIAVDASTFKLEELKKKGGDHAQRLAHMHTGANGPAITEYLKSAVEVHLDAARGSTSIAPENNIAKTKVERYGWVRALAWDMRGDMGIVRWKFLWTPPRDGFLNAITVLSMNGWGAVFPGPGCEKGSSSWSLGAGISLTQIDATGSPFTDAIDMWVEEDRYNSSDYSGFGGGVIFDAKTLTENRILTYANEFPVLANQPLLVTVSATLYVLVSHGEAELNFMDGDLQLNVPFVFLFLS